MPILNRAPAEAGVYVLHFARPYGHAAGYVGWAANIAARLEVHANTAACERAGFHVAQHRGSPLVCAALRSGIDVVLAAVHPGGNRGLERRFHNLHHRRCCPICRAQPSLPMEVPHAPHAPQQRTRRPAA